MRTITRLRKKILKIIPHSNHSSKCLILVDYQDHKRGGHFGPWLIRFAVEFSRLFDKVIIVTPKPANTKKLLYGLVANIPVNLVCKKLTSYSQSHFDLDDMAGSICPNVKDVSVFVMWGYDILDCKIFHKISCPWAGLFGFSWRIRREHNSDTKHEDKLKSQEEKLLHLSKIYSSFKCQLQLDPYVSCKDNNNIAFTDIEDVAISEQRTLLAQSIAEFSKGSLCIGIFGQLRGFRCVNEFLLLAREQKDIRFILAGKIFHRSIRSDLIKDLEYSGSSNILLLPGFITSNKELNLAIRSVDGVFIDSSRYPIHSGIVCRALHFGRWILSSSGNSWTNDLIAESGVGYTYTERDENLLSIWGQWKKNGGRQRCINKSQQLRDPALVSACFASIASKLK